MRQGAASVDLDARVMSKQSMIYRKVSVLQMHMDSLLKRTAHASECDQTRPYREVIPGAARYADCMVVRILHADR